MGNDVEDLPGHHGLGHGIGHSQRNVDDRGSAVMGLVYGFWTVLVVSALICSVVAAGGVTVGDATALVVATVMAAASLVFFPPLSISISQPTLFMNKGKGSPGCFLFIGLF